MGGRNFLLRCNYDTKYFNDLPVFYKKIPQFFNDLRILHVYDQQQDIILFNNKETLVDGKPIFFSEWFKKGIISIKDLLNENDNFLTFDEFSLKYSCKTNFLQYYQVISAVPKHFVKSRSYLSNSCCVSLCCNVNNILCNCKIYISCRLQ